MKLQTIKEVIDRLTKHDVENYIINDDLSINVHNSVNLFSRSLKEIPIKFNSITGNLNCYNNDLEILDFCPEKLDGNFNCSNNKITSLEFFPKEIGRDFNCAFNEIKHLIYIPLKIDGIIELKNNDLLGKHQNITNYEDLVLVSELYKLEQTLSINLNNNNIKKHKIKI